MGSGMSKSVFEDCAIAVVSLSLSLMVLMGAVSIVYFSILVEKRDGMIDDNDTCSDNTSDCRFAEQREN